MGYIIVYEKSNGKVLHCMSIPKEFYNNAAVHQDYIEVDYFTFEKASRVEGYVDKGEWYAAEGKPSENHIYDYDLRVWVDSRTMERAKQEKWADLKAERDTSELGGFTYNGMVFDSDQTSQGRLLGASIAGIDVLWTLQDNSQVLLTPAEIKEVYTQLQIHVIQTHARGTVAREKLDKAATLEEVDSIKF